MVVVVVESRKRQAEQDSLGCSQATGSDGSFVRLCIVLEHIDNFATETFMRPYAACSVLSIRPLSYARLIYIGQACDLITCTPQPTLGLSMSLNPRSSYDIAHSCRVILQSHAKPNPQATGRAASGPHLCHEVWRPSGEVEPDAGTEKPCSEEVKTSEVLLCPEAC